MNKTELRQSLLKARRLLSPEEWRYKSEKICQHLANWDKFQQAKTVLAYWSFRQEPDLKSLFISNHQWGLSRCVDQGLSWHLWSPEIPLERGNYGILEPPINAPILTPKNVDLILVPAVACDRRGYRLGYGGGFYDRMLSDPQWQLIPTIGITFEFAFFSQLPQDFWDRPLQGICTEMGLYFPGKSRAIFSQDSSDNNH